MEVINENYSGYYSPGPESKSIFSLWSVLQYLETGEAKSHRTRPSTMLDIKGCLSSHKIAGPLLRLVGKKAGDETIYIDTSVKMYVFDFKRKIGLEYSAFGPNLDVVFSYLKELGYLSNVKNSIKPVRGNRVPLKVANEEMREVLLDALIRSDKIVGIDLNAMLQVADTLKKILVSQSDTEFHGFLKELYMVLMQLFEGLTPFCDHGSYINESLLISVLTIGLSKVDKWERFSSDIRIQDVEGNNLTSGRTDIWMRLTDDQTGLSHVIIMEVKDFDQRKYKTSNQQKERLSLYALKEILGLEKKKPYTSALKDLKPDVYFLMGISIDHATLKPSISCLKNSVDIKEAVCLSETEFEKFPDYYEGFMNLLVTS